MINIDHKQMNSCPICQNQTTNNNLCDFCIKKLPLEQQERLKKFSTPAEQCDQYRP